MRVLNAIVRALGVSGIVTACAHTSAGTGGETVWTDVGEGRLKAQVFAENNVSERPVLILVLHGDINSPWLDYHYVFAKAVTMGFPEGSERSDRLKSALGEHWNAGEIVAAGILRPGYTDYSDDRSSGEMGERTGDNYTPEVVDAVANATRHLSQIHNPRSVVMVGHSGGGAITANLLGRHPGLVDGALLVSCGCDPEAFRSRMRAKDSRPIWSGPNPSLLPLETAGEVRQGTIVRLIVGADDDVAIPEDSRKYTEALQRRGIDVRLTVAPGLGHDILLTPEVFGELGLLVRELTSADG